MKFLFRLNLKVHLLLEQLFVFDFLFLLDILQLLHCQKQFHNYVLHLQLQHKYQHHFEKLYLLQQHQYLFSLNKLQPQMF